MANIIGTNGDDTLQGYEADTINGKAGNDTIYSDLKETLTGGGGKDKFVYNFYGEEEYHENNAVSYDDNNAVIITDFGGVGKGTNPTAAVIAEVDTLKFQGNGTTARNLLLTQKGSNLEISFEGADGTLVILENFALENLDNLSKSTGATVDLGNIIFDGQTSTTDSFDVFNASSTQSTIFNKNTVTFLNDLNNNVSGFDNSDDVINGQGGDDIIDGKSGNDILRGGAGNDILIGGAGDDILFGDEGNNTLNGGAGNDSLINYGSIGDNLLLGCDGNDYLSTSFRTILLHEGYNGYDQIPSYITSSGNNTLNGGAGDDTLLAESESGDNLLLGCDGNDYLSTSGYDSYLSVSFPEDFGFSGSSSGNNTLNGGAGNDTLLARSQSGDNLLVGCDGNDYLSTSGYDFYRSPFRFSSSGNNTLKGGAGDDTLLAEYSTGNNFLSGGDGNDYLSTSGYFIQYMNFPLYDSSSGNNTLKGGAGDDTLRAEYSTGNNFLSGGDGNDLFYVSTTSPDTAPSYLVTQTVDGGRGNDLLSVDDSSASGGITTTFNATSNITEITAGTYRVSYKNIERLNISGTAYDDNIVGSNGNDTLSGGDGGNDILSGGDGNDLFYVNTTSPDYVSTTSPDTAPSYLVTQTVDGGRGNDLLSVDDSSASGGITTTFNATSNITEITAGTYRVSYKNIERLNISGTAYDDNIVGSNGNDTLSGGHGGNDILTGGKGIDTFAFNSYNTGGVDSLYDFNATNELIQVSYDHFFGGLSPGSLQTNQFTIGTSATTSKERFIYNSATGALYFDKDGSASGFTQVQFAQLSTGLSLTNNNFVVV